MEKYNLYDKVVAESLNYVLSLEDNKFRIENFEDKNIYDLYMFKIMSISQLFNNRPIFLNMGILNYIKFKIQNRHNKIKFKRYRKKESEYSTCYHHISNIFQKLKDLHINNELLIVEEIYNEYYK